METTYPFFDKLLHIFSTLPILERAYLTRIVESDDETRLAFATVVRENIENVRNGRMDSTVFFTEALKFISHSLLEYCYKVFAIVFFGLSTEISKRKVEEFLASGGIQGSASLVYGEVDFRSFVNILERVGPQPESVFVDLGHGTGKALIASSLMFSRYFKRIHGVELLPSLYEDSISVLESYKSLLTEPQFSFIGECNANTTISICQGDFLADCSEIGEHYDWTLADVVFANSTCFDEPLMAAISLRAEALKPGAVVITFTKPLSSAAFKITERAQLSMSWGTATFFIHRRNPIVEGAAAGAAAPQVLTTPLLTAPVNVSVAEGV